uniref:branched-chain amino acid ABC transporter permease n=1 Tax=Pararhizobium sp. IMCC3301 TaxID=3067904 RepID=UPI00274130AC|nr:branched-chain amino acid ABC transporter permease [Pararhizobium sp. IMCC3301]
MLEQVLLNSVIRGSEIATLAVGVTILFSLLRFANFAHGEFALVGAYFTYFFVSDLGMNIWIAAAFGAVLGGVVALLADVAIFRQLRLSPGVVLLIASLGLSIFLRAIIAVIWGVEGRNYSDELEKIYRIGDAVITHTQIVIVVVSVLAMAGFYLLLNRTQLGRAMRAMSDNMTLAKARGIDVEVTIRWIWFIVGSYAALGGTLIAMDTQLWPDMGVHIILVVFAATVLGGIGNVYGAVIGSFMIGLLENGSLAIDWSFLVAPFGYDGSLFLPTGYKFAVSFAVLILVMLFFPKGIMKGSSGDQ